MAAAYKRGGWEAAFVFKFISRSVFWLKIVNDQLQLMAPMEIPQRMKHLGVFLVLMRIGADIYRFLSFSLPKIKEKESNGSWWILLSFVRLLSIRHVIDITIQTSALYLLMLHFFLFSNQLNSRISGRFHASILKSPVGN